MPRSGFRPWHDDEGTGGLDHEGMTTWERYRHLVAQGSDVERAAFFSDAVFAIALTVLVIEIRIPAVPQRELLHALLEALPEYLTFVLSFVVIGTVWLSHHRKFRMMSGHDQTLLRLNLLLLLLVASLPIPTAVLGRYGDTAVAVCLYAGGIALIGLAMSSIWAYARRRGMTSPAVTRDLYLFMLGQSLVIPAVFTVSIPVALVAGGPAGELTWLLSVPLYVALGRICGERLTRVGASSD